MCVLLGKVVTKQGRINAKGEIHLHLTLVDFNTDLTLSLKQKKQKSQKEESSEERRKIEEQKKLKEEAKYAFAINNVISHFLSLSLSLFSTQEDNNNKCKRKRD
jgi:ribosomal 50S subunit-recycling heat shock protein